MKEKILSRDHNGESNQWHKWPAIVKLDLTMTDATSSVNHSLHWFLKGRTNHGHKSTQFIFFDISLLKVKILSKDHN